jgi:hypothetical protein
MKKTSCILHQLVQGLLLKTLVKTSVLNIERWTGKAWYPVMLSPFNSHAEVNEYLKRYWWHFTEKNPYRITNS